MKSPTEVRAGSAVQARTEVEVGLPSCLFQYVEFCIFNLHSHTRMLDQRRKELADMVIYSGPLANAGENNVGLVDGGKSPVPAAQKFLEMQDLDEDIRVLRKRIDPLIAMIRNLGGRYRDNQTGRLFCITRKTVIMIPWRSLRNTTLLNTNPGGVRSRRFFHYSQRAFGNKRNRLVKRLPSGCAGAW